MAYVSRNDHCEKHDRVQRMEMEETLKNHDLSKQNMEIHRKKTENVIKMNKCNQRNYESSHKVHLRAQLRIKNWKSCIVKKHTLPTPTNRLPCEFPGLTLKVLFLFRGSGI